MMRPSFILAQWTRLIMGELASAGVEHVVISPGSRSTPLVFSALRESRLTCHAVIDERSAGFFALGLARASGKAVVLVCTSGSALAHYLPALIEAHHAQIPLIVISADRPFELQGCGAPQTIEQTGIYGAFARTVPNPGEPSPAIDKLRNLQNKIAQIAHFSGTAETVCAHLNLPFQKPLVPTPNAASAEELTLNSVVAQLLRNQGATLSANTSQPSNQCYASFLDKLAERGTRTLVVLGPAGKQAALAASELAALLGLPLVGDLPDGCSSVPLEALPALFNERPELAPERVLHIGPPVISGEFAKYVKNAEFDFLVASGERSLDPSHRASQVLLGKTHLVLQELRERASGFHSETTDYSRALSLGLAKVENELRATIDTLAQDKAHASLIPELVAVRAVLRAVPSPASFLLANSLTIRLASWCATNVGHGVMLYTARGANGIDGWIAAAAGASIFTDAPVIAVMGDVTAAHDLSSLALLNSTKKSVSIVVLDNGGGRIFDHLPGRSELASEDDFEKFWNTPPNLNWGAAAQTYGIGYAHCTSPSEVRGAIGLSTAQVGATLVHVKTDPESTHQFLSTMRGVQKR